MGWLGRLFQNGYEKALVDSAQYRAPVDRAVILDEIARGRAGGDHETRPFMLRAVQEINPKGELTIAAVADSYDSMRTAMSRPYDRCFHEFGVLSAAGDHMLLNYLIQRANRIAQGVKPGATDALGAAF